LKPVKDSERKWRESIERHYIKRREKKEILPAAKVPKQCPLVLLQKVCQRKGKMLGSGDFKVMRSELFLVMSKGKKLGRVLLHLIGILNFEIDLGRAASGGILIFTLGQGYFRAEILNLNVKTGRAACEEYSE
jgi:hypothetical protein